MSTEKNRDVKKIISRLMSVYGLHKPKEVADKLGVSSQVLNNWISRNSQAALDKIREVIGGSEAEDIIYGPRPPEAFDVPPPTSRIPIVSWAQAGPGGFFEDSFPVGSGFGEVNRPYDVTDPNAYALIVSGDSMSPKFEPGDIILVSPNMGVRTGDYAVVRLKDGTVAAKRVKAKNGKFILESVNPEYPQIECQAEDVVFLHRIVWVKQRG